ncbi:MAG: hypothetical protein MHM6MM_005715 [Cercozoa sp. M6MM]
MPLTPSNEVFTFKVAMYLWKMLKWLHDPLPRVQTIVEKVTKTIGPPQTELEHLFGKEPVFPADFITMRISTPVMILEANEMLREFPRQADSDGGVNYRCKVQTHIRAFMLKLRPPVATDTFISDTDISDTVIGDTDISDTVISDIVISDTVRDTVAVTDTDTVAHVGTVSGTNSTPSPESSGGTNERRVSVLLTLDSLIGRHERWHGALFACSAISYSLCMLMLVHSSALPCRRRRRKKPVLRKVLGDTRCKREVPHSRMATQIASGPGNAGGGCDCGTCAVRTAVDSCSDMSMQLPSLSSSRLSSRLSTQFSTRSQTTGGHAWGIRLSPSSHSENMSIVSENSQSVGGAVSASDTSDTGDTGSRDSSGCYSDCPCDDWSRVGDWLVFLRPRMLFRSGVSIHSAIHAHSGLRAAAKVITFAGAGFRGWGPRIATLAQKCRCSCAQCLASFDDQVYSHGDASGVCYDVLHEEYRREKEFLFSQMAARHEHFVGAFDAIEDSHGAMLLLRLCSYDSLPNFVLLLHAKLPASPLRSILESIVSQMNAALHKLHLSGYVHGDIKPSNFVVDENLCVKLCDFGSVHLADRDTLRHTPFRCFGTALYASPEVLALKHGGDEARTALGDSGFAIDMWAFGMAVADMTRCLPSFVVAGADPRTETSSSSLPTIWESDEERVRSLLSECLMKQVRWRYSPSTHSTCLLDSLLLDKETCDGNKNTACMEECETTMSLSLRNRGFDDTSLSISQSESLQTPKALSGKLAAVVRACISIQPSSRATTQDVAHLLSGQRELADLSLSRRSSGLCSVSCDQDG